MDANYDRQQEQRLDFTQIAYTLRHLETGEYVCLRQDGLEYLAAFTQAEEAETFRDSLHLLEFVDIVPIRLNSAPFDCFCLDGQMIRRETPVAY